MVWVGVFSPFNETKIILWLGAVLRSLDPSNLPQIIPGHTELWCVGWFTSVKMVQYMSLLPLWTTNSHNVVTVAFNVFIGCKSRVYVCVVSANCSVRYVFLQMENHATSICEWIIGISMNDKLPGNVISICMHSLTRDHTRWTKHTCATCMDAHPIRPEIVAMRKRKLIDRW